MESKVRFPISSASSHGAGGGLHDPTRKSALQERLKHIVLLELKENGGREYHTMTLRGLYDYVIKSITSQGRGIIKSDQMKEVDGHHHRQTSVRTFAGAAVANISPTQNIPKSSLLSIPEKALPPSAVISERVETLKSSFKPSSRSILSSEQEQHGNINNTNVTYRERLGGYLHPRDMRRLVTPFSSSNEPELMVRRHVMLLNFDPLRAIVLRDRLLILVPDGADSILMDLERHVRGGIEDMAKGVFGEDTMHGSAGGFSSSKDNLTADDLDDNLDQSLAEDGESTIVEGIEFVEKNEKGKRKNRIKGAKDSRSQKDGDNDKYFPDADHDNEGSYIINTEISGNDEDGDDYGEGDIDDRESSTSTVVSKPNGLNNEWDDLEEGNWIRLPFELQCVDSVLSSVVKMLSSDSMSLRKKIFSVMEEMRGDASTNVPGDHVQEQLRILKDNVREMESRVQGFVRAMNLILDDEEDMALMNLSRLISNPERFIQPVSQQVLNEESDEPELILEVYLQQANGEVNALNLLKGNILNTEELVSLQMDTVRNRLLYINTVVSVITLSVTCASLVGSFFGMNLTNHYEMDDKAFREVVAGTLVGTISLLVVVLVAISKTGVMPANPRKVLYSKQRVDVDMRK